MKKFLINNKISFAVFLALLIWCIWNLISLSHLTNYDAITVFFYTLTSSNLSMLQLIAPLFVVIPCVYKFHRQLHSGSIKNILTRQSYKEYFKKILMYGIKTIWILPVAMLILFFGSILVTKNFDFTNAVPKVIGVMDGEIPVVIPTISSVHSEFYNTPVKLMLTFFMVIMIHSLLYANIGIIMCKKNKNVIVSIVLSFLIFICIAMCSEVLFATLMIKVLGFNSLDGIFNLFEIWTYSDFSSLTALIVYSSLLLIISYIILGTTYRNKEKVIIESEK